MKLATAIALLALLAACGAGNPDSVQPDPTALLCSPQHPENCPPPPPTRS